MNDLVLDNYDSCKLDMNSMKAKEYQHLIKFHSDQINMLKVIRRSQCTKAFTTNPIAHQCDKLISEHTRRMEDITTKYTKIYTIV